MPSAASYEAWPTALACTYNPFECLPPRQTFADGYSQGSGMTETAGALLSLLAWLLLFGPLFVCWWIADHHSKRRRS